VPRGRSTAHTYTYIYVGISVCCESQIFTTNQNRRPKSQKTYEASNANVGRVTEGDGGERGGSYTALKHSTCCGVRLTPC